MSRVDLLDLMEIAEGDDADIELAEIVAELPAAGEVEERGTARQVSGTCAACGNPARGVCLRCERRVCSRHYRVMFGLCQECAPQRDGTEGGPPRGLDIPWIE